MRQRIKQLIDKIQQSMRSPYFGFVQGHAHLLPPDLKQIERLVGVQAEDVVADYETRFAKLVGQGEAIAYAAARMGFYDLMRHLGVGKDDEVILLGATCAVMVNAVMRAGATPVFTDIDPQTFRSAAQTIAPCITQKTRMIVAQHSFGIPCDIAPIVELAKRKTIFLLEDCALTLGSKVNNVTVGNFGDAALFSTDHSKPINTLTGGLIYTSNSELANSLRLSQATCLELSIVRQKALWHRFLFESRYCVPVKYGRIGLIDLFVTLKKKLLSMESDFLSEDFGTNITLTYPYPAKLPAFLAAVGKIEVERWSIGANERKLLLDKLLDILNDSSAVSYVPNAYKDNRLQIVPLRLAWFEPDGANVRKDIKQFIHVPWTWFIEPIIATSERLENMGYYVGVCLASERIGPKMVNIPCNIPLDDMDKLTSLFRRVCV